MKNLFIDSNIWLSLYHFTNDDLAQFSKLKDMVNKSIRLFVPQQVYDEITRNREAKLKDALKSFDIKAFCFPAFCKGYSEFETVKNAYNDFMNKANTWKKRIDADIETHHLPADETITQIFETVWLIPCQDYVDKAYMRYRIGNPPGKDNKYGDAINWECLLANVPNGEDLYFISADKDYCSDITDGRIKDFLRLEWRNAKGSEIHYYKNLVPFLTENISDIKLETETEKQRLIDQLSNSGNFQSTHATIAMLKMFSGWTEDQIEKLCTIAEDNTQVSWILKDPDVFEFYSHILSEKNVESLPDSAAKRILEELCYSDSQDEQNNAKADTDHELEEYFKH